MRIAWAISILLAVGYLLVIGINAAPFPIHDDYHDSLQFVLAYADTEDLSRLGQLLLSQHMEHRQVLNHVLFAVYFELSGMLDYQLLLVIANCWIVVLFLLYARLFESPALRIFGALLLFNAAYWNGSFWLVAAASNFPVVTLALLTLMLLQIPGRTAFVAAGLSAVLTGLAFGNGLGILALGALSLWLQGQRRLRLGLWLLGSGLFVLLYFHNYQQPEIIQSMFYRGQEQDAWQLVLASPLQFLRWVLAVIGSGFSFGHRDFGTGCGALLVAAWLWLSARREYRRQSVALLFSAFLLLTLSLAAYKRFVLAFTEVALPNRYSFYSITLGLFLCAAFIRNWQHQQKARHTVWIAIAAAIVFNGFSWWWGLAQAQAMISPLRANLLNWMQGGDHQLFVMFAEEPANSLHQAMSRGIYTPLSAIPSDHQPESLRPIHGLCPPQAVQLSPPPEGALVIRLDRAKLKNPGGHQVRLCFEGKQFLLQFDQLPVYVPLPLRAINSKQGAVRE